MTAVRPTRPLCLVCSDTGLENHAEVSAYWGAVYGGIDAAREDGRYISRGPRSPEPADRPCGHCPHCAVCFGPIATHTDRQAVDCMRDYFDGGEEVLHVQYGKDPKWVLPDGEVKA